MENEITWYNNIKQLVFNNYTYEDYDNIFKTLNEVYRSASPSSDRLWFDFKYLNSLLNLYLINHSKFKNPYPIFFALIFKHITSETRMFKTSSVEMFNRFLQLERTYSLDSVNKAVKFLLLNNVYTPNDLGICESDFDLYNDILLTHKPAKISPTLIAGVYFGSSYDLLFKFRRKTNYRNFETIYY